MDRNELLDVLIKLNAKATKAPWSGSMNYPFYGVLNKPAPSLSKHDQTKPHLWRINDVELVLFLRNNLDLIIESLK